MANSDNTLRGGLTNKHIDVDELLKVLSFREYVPEKIAGRKYGKETHFECPAREFQLSVFRLENAAVPLGTAAQCMLVIEGALNITSGGEKLAITHGQSAYIEPGAGADIFGEGFAIRVTAP